jgi:hypothetical protein
VQLLDIDIARLRAATAEGVTIWRSEAFNMVGDSIDLSHIYRGARDPEYDKTLLFDPVAVDNLWTARGNHRSLPEGRLRWADDPLTLFHFKYIKRTRRESLRPTKLTNIDAIMYNAASSETCTTMDGTSPLAAAVVDGVSGGLARAAAGSGGGDGKDGGEATAPTSESPEASSSNARSGHDGFEPQMGRWSRWEDVNVSAVRLFEPPLLGIAPCASHPDWVCHDATDGSTSSPSMASSASSRDVAENVARVETAVQRAQQEEMTQVIRQDDTRDGTAAAARDDAAAEQDTRRPQEEVEEVQKKGAPHRAAAAESTAGAPPPGLAGAGESRPVSAPVATFGSIQRDDRGGSFDYGTYYARLMGGMGGMGGARGD